MAKSKKKKNFKLRRRVKRTVAALTMVMAIVVAAIPVENYGTMQASGVDGKNLEADAKDYIDKVENGKVVNNLYDPTEYEDTYPDTDANTKTAQHIEGDTFIDAYKIRIGDNNNAIISKSIFKTNIEKFDIYEEEYYGYVKMDSAYINAIRDTFKDEIYELLYKTTTPDNTTYYGKNVIVTHPDNSTTSENLDDISIVKVDMDIAPNPNIPNQIKDTNIGVAEKDNRYNKVNNTVPDVEKIYTDFAPSILKEHTDKLSGYNADMKAYTDILDNILAKTIITPQDVTNWKDTAAAIKILNDTINDSANRMISTTFSTILSKENKIDEDGNDLEDLIDYTICQRMNSGSDNLKKYALKRLTTPTGAYVYVPVNISGQGPDGDQKNDTLGYLAEGKVTIRGIASNAFSPDNHEPNDNDNGQIRTLTIPSTVQFIGANAFANSNFLESVTIDDSACEILGDEAFSGCVHLESIQFTSGNSELKKIGRKAFYNTLLQNIVFPEFVSQIGVGCLYFSDIQEITMGGLKNETLTIDPYAFFGCEKLTKVNFAGETTEFKMGDGVFALTASQGGGSMESFTFPSYMNKIDHGDDYSEYILAGRENLKTVVLPGRLGNSVGKDSERKVPDTTFAGCKQLECVEFPNGAHNATYDPKELFKEVLNDKFYVRGPESGASSGSVASPRSCTWNAVPGYSDDDGKPGVVPYVYIGADGKEHMEIGVGEDRRDDYIATIDIIDATAKTASLSGYTENRRSDLPLAVVVPETVGGYTILEIADGCFKNVRDIIYKVIIADGTVQRINANAFRNCAKLQWVELGDSVSFIGANAFEGCKSLENVFFSQTQTALFGDEDSYWEDALTIENNAFKTGSDFLTFHGAVHPEYAPYKLAMSEEGKSMTGSSLQICYKTDAPTNLTILRDNDTGERTLIDYPHYEEIDTINKDLIQMWAGDDDFNGYSITNKFEEKNELRNTSDPEYADRPFNTYKNFSEEDIPRYTLFMTIPKGIDSIDAKAYYNNTKNASDLAYLTRKYEPQIKHFNDKDIEIGIKGETGALERNINQYRTYRKYNDVKSIYSDDKYISESDLDEFGQEAGLFSGFLAESDSNTDITRIADSISGIIWRTYNGHEYVENSVVGNDYLTTIDLKTIKELPDYAFMSCENLLETSYGTEMQTIGALPYRNCKSLTQINIPAANQYVQFGNMILFRKNQDGLEIIQCLEGRGSGSGASGSFKVGEESGDTLLANVVSIDNEAFSYCDEITEVDLSTSSITQVPERCFYKAEKLGTVILPESIETIGAEAFLNTSDNMEITIPNPSCAIGETAFNFDGDRKVTIIGPEYDGSGTRNSAIYNFYVKMKDKLKSQGKENNIQFVSDDKHKVTFIDYDTSLIVDPDVQNPQYVDHEGNAICVAKPERSGYEFSAWKCILSDGTQFTGSGDPWLNVTEDRIIQAVYVPNSNIVVPDGNDYTLTIKGGTANGKTESITAKGGDRILVIADTKTDGSKFQYWTVEPSTYAYLLVDAVTTANTTFIMPNANVTLTANFSSSSGGNGSGGDDNKPGGDDNKPGEDGKKYKVTVNYGSGSGEYAAGATVNISAYAPDSPNRVFSKWTTSNSGLSFVNANAATTSFVMPAADVTVTANYKVRSDDDDDDDDEPSRRPGNNTSTTTVPNRPGSSSTGTTGTTGTVTNPSSESSSTGNTTSNNGNKIYITKNGVSNKDVASISVDGSTDNFIVRITESAEATAAVEEALINRYGSLDGLVYFPMDISLYDSTGQNKITDTYGLNITVTMPIPDVLIQYGGNSRVAAADNGNLQQLTPRFTTIDGIACISFVPPHFSPYVIYVDTSNLTAGQTLDSTPSTGDPIHPKWFAAIGMACISILLFVTSDGRKRKNYKAA